jgi:hypothetical protein
MMMTVSPRRQTWPGSTILWTLEAKGKALVPTHLGKKNKHIKLVPVLDGYSKSSVSAAQLNFLIDHFVFKKTRKLVEKRK